MKMRMPARRRVLTTAGISSRGGSTMATRPTRVRPERACSIISVSNPVDEGDDLIHELDTALWASSRTRRPLEDHSFLICSICSRAAASRGMGVPDMPV